MSASERGHRTSTSRIVPAIPLALGGKSRRSLERPAPKVPDRLGSEEQASQGASSGTGTNVQLDGVDRPAFQHEASAQGQETSGRHTPGAHT